MAQIPPRAEEPMPVLPGPTRPAPFLPRPASGAPPKPGTIMGGGLGPLPRQTLEERAALLANRPKKKKRGTLSKLADFLSR